MVQSVSGIEPLRVGYDRQDITPAGRVFLAGQFYARVSEGVADPLTVTAMAIDQGSDHVVLVSADVLSIPDAVLEAVQRKVAGTPGLDPTKVIISATHTHTAPDLRVQIPGRPTGFGGPGMELGMDNLPVAAYVDFFTTQVAVAVRQAWTRRGAAQVAYGLTDAVIGRNRRWVNRDGVSTMYGDTTVPEFDHIEGYEDPSINVLATWDEAGTLTGVVLNIACTSQLSEHEFVVSADFWHETRNLIWERHGKQVHVVAQCSAAGDLSPRPIWGKQAQERMLRLKGRTARQEIAHRLADALDQVLPFIKPVARGDLLLRHLIQTVDLPLNQLTQKDADEARRVSDELQRQFDEEKARIDADPTLRQKPRWYTHVTMRHRQATWHRGVIDRFERLKTQPTQPTTIHVVRIGGMVMATNPFEYYLDFGIRVKARSPFEQTFLVQLAGPGTYLPSERSVSGGGYGSVPASNPVGPEGGEVLCEKTLELIGRALE